MLLMKYVHFRKSWVTCYAKLSASNLVFYKDMKSAKTVPGSPFGKSDFMIPLQGCQVSKATKDVTSKRNVLVVSYHCMSTVCFLFNFD